MRRTFLALLLASLLPGCAWFGGGGDAEASAGPQFHVTVENQSGSDLRVRLEVTEDGFMLHEASFDLKAGATEERSFGYERNGTKVVRLSYAMDAEGRGATGKLESAFDPGDCQGEYRVAFQVRSDEEARLVAGSNGRCDVEA